MDSNRNIPQNTCYGVIIMVYSYSELDLCENCEMRSNL